MNDTDEREFPQFQLYETPTRRGAVKLNHDSPGRTPSGNGRQWQLTNLWEHHHVMKRLTILGWKPKEIATYLGMDPVSVRNCLNSEIMKREIELMRGALDKRTLDIGQKLQEMAVKSCEVLDELLENDNVPAAVRSKIALDVLSRAGHPPQVAIKGTVDHRHFTTAEIEELKQVAKQPRELEEEVPDAEFTVGQVN